MLVSAFVNGGMDVPLDRWTRPTFNAFNRILVEVQELERALGFEPTTVDRVEWMPVVEARLRLAETIAARKADAR